MWRPFIPQLAEKFTVIAPDLPGIGDSSIPATGLDMKNSAIRIHALVKALGINKARVVGHDIGLMVAYAYAAQFPTETEKLVLVDAFLQASPAGRTSTTIPGFGISASTARRQKRWCGDASGRTSTISGHHLLRTRRIRLPKPTGWPSRLPMHVLDGCVPAGRYFVSFQQAAKDFAQLAQHKLPMPVLALGGEKANGRALGEQTKLVADDSTIVVLKNCGHWVMEEQPKEAIEALTKFL